VHLAIWHGYLLADTGSNIYTQAIARAWGHLGHDVTLLCQEPRPERYDLGPTVRVVRPDIGRLLPVFVLDRYEGLEARHVADFGAREVAAYTRANARALRADLREREGALVLANHAVMGGPVARSGTRGPGTPYVLKVHGSELEYAIAGHEWLAPLARGGLDEAAAVVVGSDHIRQRTAALVGEGQWLERTHTVPPGVDVEAFAPGRGSLAELARLLVHRPDLGDRGPDAGAADRLTGLGRFVLYFGKLLRQKGVHTLLEAWRAVAERHPGVTLVVVGFGTDRAELEADAGERVVFTGAMDHAQLQRLVPLADAVVVPSVLPEAFGMVAAEAASCGVVPIVADHSGLAEVADGLGAGGRRFDGTAADLAARLDELLSLDADGRRRLGAIAREAVIRRWSWEGIAGRLLELVPEAAQGRARAGR